MPATNLSGGANDRVPRPGIARDEATHRLWLAALTVVLCAPVLLTGCAPEAPVPSSAAARRSPTPVTAAGNPAGSPEAVATRREPDVSREARPEDWFEDITQRTGIHFVHRNGREAKRFFMIESFGGGVAMFDYDRDDQVDLFFAGGGTISSEDPAAIAGLPAALYRNLGHLQFADVTHLACCDRPPDYSQGCAVADYNGDGFADVLVTCYGRSRLYCNQGDGTFLELGADQLPPTGWATAACFGDADHDGLADLFLARYTDWSPATDKPCYYGDGQRDLCGPIVYPGTSCVLLHNRGDGGFEDHSAQVGLTQHAVHGLGVVAADLNDDTWLDFYVASDALASHLYLGTADGTLVENGVLAGVAFGEWGQAEASMGIDIGDYNGDGLPDIFVTNFEDEDNALYRNLGNGTWIHSTVAAHLFGHSRMRSGFGTAFLDFDHDGWLDLFVLNGNPIYEGAKSPYKQAAQLFRNQQGQRFEDVTEAGGPFFHEKHSGRGTAVGDLDNDGALDIVTVPMNEPVQILRGKHPPQNYVRVQLVALHGEPDATGARVSVARGDRRLVRFCTHGSGYLSAADSRLVFPLAPEDSHVDITVNWPGGQAEIFRQRAGRQTHWLVEGAGEAVNEQAQDKAQ